MKKQSLKTRDLWAFHRGGGGEDCIHNGRDFALFNNYRRGCSDYFT